MHSICYLSGFNMRHLVIKNVGPIKNVNIELNRFNFIIGPQCSGKSTVAKVLSCCTWIEKETITTLNENAIPDSQSFLQLIEGFHKMEGYFNENSVIEYETKNISITFKDNKFKTSLKEEEDYYRKKICYIPAERNMVTLPELQGFEFGQTNLRSFLFDWFKAREFYVPKNKTNVLNLGVKYFYDSEQLKQKDRIEHVNGSTYGIALSSASSGLQSVIPLLIMLQYYTGKYFESYLEKLSFDGGEKAKKVQRILIDKYVLKKIRPDFEEEERLELVVKVDEELQKGNEHYQKLLKEYQKAFRRLTIPVSSSFVIEEPEQNLFPETQMDLLDMLVFLCDGEKKHECTITTHSPYILNQLNLLFKRYDVGVSQMTKLNWEDVSVWAIEEGSTRDLKLKNAHLINPEYLSAPLDKIYDEYEECENSIRK